MTDEERRSYENLLFLCYAHHVETNEVDEFPPERLVTMKRRHEAQFANRPYLPPRGIVASILSSWIDAAALMSLRAMRAEVPSHLDGIRTAQKAYFAEHGVYVTAGSEAHARSQISTALRAWDEGDAWQRLGWRPDGEVRGGYWTTAMSDDFEVWGVIDCDGDGNVAEYKATRWSRATRQTDDQVF